VISAHLGNWEIAGLVPSLCYHHPSAYVARELNSKVLDRFLNKARTRFGNIIIDKKGALPKMVRLLHKGWLVGVLMDQGTNRTEGVECTFFGKEVYTTPVASLLARRYNYPVVPGYCSRDKDGMFSVVFKPPLKLVKTNNAEADMRTNTQLMNDAIEDCIRECPEQYFWFHKRWKRHYPHLYPEDLARKKRIRERRRQKRARAES
jgi:KDO2-lipid IV(A) lauroyltransferase